MLNINNLQAMFDGISAQEARKRAESQMTLGKLMSELELMLPETQVANLCFPDSYRGYYSDLYFEKQEGTRPASELLDVCKASMGKVFEGYKGGDYVMGASTPLWIATYGCCCGDKLIALKADGDIEIQKDD